jgi:GNAT superfamily N-acetyltransferase
MVGTVPEYQGQGIGSKLIQWGTSQADEKGLECYLSATPKGLRLYEKFDFVRQHEAPKFLQSFMVRPPLQKYLSLAYHLKELA